MKKLILAVLMWGAAIHGAFAQTPQANDQFDVNITLNSVCTMSTVTDVAFTYTSLGAAANATGGAFSVTCTSTFPYQLGLFVGATPSGTGAASIGPILDNNVNLNYSLTLATTSATGSGVAQNYNIGGTIAAGQSGTCATASCTNTGATNKTHSLIFSY